MPEDSLTNETAVARTQLLAWRNGPFPLVWAGIFGGTAPLHLEIGFGDGRYTVRRALSQPDEHFVGVEVSGVSVLRALRRTVREHAGNVALLKGPAQVVLQQMFAPVALTTITVNFPDPWPKGRHEDNRLLQRSFFELAASRLVPGGSVLLATDHLEYLQFARAEAAASGLFALHAAEPPAAVFETKYALKWKGQGKPLYYQPFVRNATLSGEFPHLERPVIMPHSLLQGDVPTIDEFSKLVVSYGGGHVIVHEAARSARTGTRWLFRITVDEADLIQQMIVVLQQRADGNLIIRLEPFGDPLITPTVRGAVHAVTEWALQQPGVRLLERHY